MAKQTTEAMDLQQRMAVIRHDIDQDVCEIVESTRRAMDWKNYVRSHPFAVAACAAAAGYLIVPNRTQIVSPNANELEKLAKRNKLVVKQKPEAQVEVGVGGKLFTLVSNALMRAAFSYVGQKVGSVVDGQVNGSDKSSTTSPRPAAPR